MNKEYKIVPKLRFPEFQLSSDWKEKTLGEVTYNVGEKNKDGIKYPIYSINNKEGFIPQSEQFDGVDSNARGYDISLYKVIKRNTFAYNPARINVGSIGYSGELHNIIISSLYVCFKATEELDDNFLRFFIETNFFYESVNNNAEGGIRNYLFYENFSRIKIYLPKLSEQQKIADCLSSIDELISAHTQKLEALKDHKKGLMQHLFPAEGETVPKLRFKEFENDGEWVEKQLKDICKMQAGKFISASDINKYQSDNLYPCYGGNGLRGFTKSYTHSGLHSLIGRQGALCGNITLVSEKFHATEHAIVVTLETNVNTPWFYYLLILLDLNKYATGQAQPGLSVENLEKVKIKISMNEEEQQKIASCLSSLDSQILIQMQTLSDLKEHKKGLMQQLFPIVNDISQ